MSNKNPSISRRKFVRSSALVSGGVMLLPTLLSACKDDEPDMVYTGDFGFREGVASFDPSASSVILWTRYTNAANEPDEATLAWEVSSTDAFTALVASGMATAAAAADYTVAVNVAGLTANQKYFYRFRNQRTATNSVVGETRTLPTGSQASSIKLAVVSCANFQAGLFNVYGAVAASDADAVVHLGDYIYEYGAGQYGTTGSTAALNRAHLPATEILSLSDYRTRYRQYRSDKQLQRAHQLKPFICIWDDHEYANDAYSTGAENHQPATEGSFEDRKRIANQVWFEYLPARTADKAKIYRSFEFGNLVNLLMLDTRIVGRDKQLSLIDYFSSTGTFNTAAFATAWQNPNRSMLGTEQRAWLASALGSSTAKWQAIGSQVLMGKMYIPTELLPLIAQLVAGGPTPALLAQYNTQATQLSIIKTRILNNDPTVTAAERARVETVLPYNLDAWDGYPVEREKLYAAAGTKKVISLAGDTHNAWHSDLRDNAGRRAGAEFACSSVSSPGFEAPLAGNTAAIQGFEQSIQLLIDDLQYIDASRRGYVLASFTATNATAEYRYVASLDVESNVTTTGKTVVEV